MNGKERNLSQFRKLSAYIMQDNQLHGNLTVEEAMTVATNLKLSTKVDKNGKIDVVSSSYDFHWNKKKITMRPRTRQKWSLVKSFEL